MTTQPEALLEAQLVAQLRGMGYGPVVIQDDASLLANLQAQLEAFNGTTFTQRDMTRLLNHLQKGTLYDRSKILRDRYALEREDGTVTYVRFFDGGDPAANQWQVTQQVTNVGSYTNRYDVTILCNGLPVVQVELKRSGLEVKEAFNQIIRYKRHSFWANGGLFQYIQLFAISNGVNTKYYVNNPIEALTFTQTFYWTDEDSRRKAELKDFTADLLSIPRLCRMISHYTVLNDRDKRLMVLRPYQVFAVEAIVDKVRNYDPAAADRTDNYGYIWHTTGSGKTLTSFKASQVIMGLPDVAKVVFVVDRKDLDYKTMEDFNDYKEGSVDATENTKGLVEQLGDPNTKLIVTTIQKLHIAISKVRHEKKVEALKDARMVFIFDECHRSQFGKTHGAITSYFTNAQLFGFTGTPIFAENASKNDLGKRTTKQLFGACLHKYVITDAIRDENVLRFSVEYVGRYKKKEDGIEMDIDVEDIDRAEVFDDEKRLGKVVDNIISIHYRKTHNREYSALFAVSSIPLLMKYYELFRQRKEAGAHDLRIAAIYSYGTNEEDEEAVGALPEDTNLASEPPATYGSGHSRDAMDRIIGDYNAQFGTAFSTKDQKGLENYFKDITKKLREREKTNAKDSDRIDLVLVVNMMLTGFDAKKVNTLYVDKRLRYHGLIQAYSRTNRILNEKKSQGNIVAYRNLKKATDDALALFSNKDAKEIIFLPPYQKLVAQFIAAYKKLLEVAPTVRAVDALVDEEQQLAFVSAFRELIRLLNVLKTYAEFDWRDLPITEQVFAGYTSKYLDLRDSVQRQRAKDKHSILEDIDFEVVLVHRDEINVAYILKLLARLKGEEHTAKGEAMRKQIMSLLSSDVELRSKRELIEKFIAEHLPKITDPDRIQDEFEKYWEDQRVMALHTLCEEEHLDQKQFNNLIETYIFTGQEPLKDDVIKCLEARPSVLKAREVGERIVERMKEYVEVFVRGMVA
ncbi:MAG: type I restriction endonuclease subunit R [Flavobacteriales bacterium]|nr:type I restriction endonuclease subunit R [Flavobacteriales bacterium]